MTTCTILEGRKAKISFEFSAEEFEKAIGEAYVRTAKYYTVPGFRKGKAPRSAIIAKYGIETFYQDALESIFRENYSAAIEEHKLEPYGEPDLDVEQMEQGKELKFSVTLELYPEVVLGEYKGIEVKRSEYNVTDDAVEEGVSNRLEEQRKGLERMVSVERALQNGDVAELDYSGSVDGVLFEGGTAENQTLEIGSGTFIPGFEEQMVGMNAGEERDIEVTFPTEYHSAELAGKAAVFHVKLHGVRVKEYPELDDELAKDVSEFETLDEFKASLRTSVKEALEKEAELKYQDTVLAKALENATVSLPESMIAAEVEDMIKNSLSRMGVPPKMSLEEVCSIIGGNPEELRADFRERAIARLNAEMFLSKVAQAEEISLSDEELDAEASKVVEDYSNEEITDDMKAKLKDSLIKGERREYFIYQLRCDRARKLIVDAAKCD